MVTLFSARSTGSEFRPPTGSSHQESPPRDATIHEASRLQKRRDKTGTLTISYYPRRIAARAWCVTNFSGGGFVICSSLSDMELGQGGQT